MSQPPADKQLVEKNRVDKDVAEDSIVPIQAHPVIFNFNRLSRQDRISEFPGDIRVGLSPFGRVDSDQPQTPIVGKDKRVAVKDPGHNPIRIRRRGLPADKLRRPGKCDIRRYESQDENRGRYGLDLTHFQLIRWPSCRRPQFHP